MMDINEEFWNPINFNETDAGQNSQTNGSDATIESESQDNYSNPIGCEVLMDTGDSPGEPIKNIRDNVRAHHFRKYFQITKKDLTALLNRNDKSVVIKENSSRKPELVYHYRRVCVGDKETEFVRCIHCKELLCYSSYDGTTSVTRHLTSCTKMNDVNFKPYELDSSTKKANSNNSTPAKTSTVVIKQNNGTGKRAATTSMTKLQAPSSKIIKTICIPIQSPNLNTTPIKATYKSVKQAKLDINSLKEEFSKTAMNAIVTSMLPIDFFDTKGIKEYFQKLINIGAEYGTVQIGNILPNGDETRKAFTGMIAKIQERLKVDLNELSTITLLIDDFKCKIRDERFVVLSVQYSNDGTLRNRVLGLKQYSELQLRQKDLQDSLSYFSLENKTINVVSSMNPRDHLREDLCSRLCWWNCTINQLNQTLTAMVNQLMIEPSTKEIAHFIEKCPSIYHYFNSLVNSTFQNDSSLKMILDANDAPHSNNNLSSNNLNDNEITHEMIFKTLMMIKEKEHSIYDDHNLSSIIGQVDLKMLGKVRNILNNFYEAKKFISVENSITFNLVLPCLKKLTMVCNSNEEQDYRIKSFKFLLNSLLEEHFCVSDEHKIATFLTPKFRSMRNLCTNEEVTTLIAKLEQQLLDAKDEIKREEDNFFEFCKADDITIKCDEVDVYLKHSLTNQDITDDPLKFWQRNIETYPKLSKYAINLLSIPASSTGYTEKLFNSTDLVDLSKRMPIQKRLDDFLFINSNLDLLDKINH